MSVFYRGVSQAQDPRFRDRERAELDARSWPAFVARSWAVAPERVERLRLWVEDALRRLLNREDEITAHYVVGWLSAQPPGDCRVLWLSLEPLLGAGTAGFFEGLRAAVDGAEEALAAAEAERCAVAEAARKAERGLLRAYRRVLEEYGSDASSSSAESPPHHRARRLSV